MLVIKPIEEKARQRELVLRCGGQYREHALAYLATECEADGETVRYPIGVCQFSLSGSAGVIDLLRCLPCIDDREALMIMARAAMSFLSRCGFAKAVIKPSAAPVELIRELGFRDSGDGRMTIDLAAFYAGPCRFSPDKE